MCKIKLLLLTGTLFTALAAGCQPLIRPVTPTAATAVQRTSATTNHITDTVAIADTGVFSDAVTTIASTALIANAMAMTSTVASAETAAVSAPTTAELVADTPTPGVDQPTASPAPMLTVVIASLRIRSGPGTEYPVLGAAAQGEQYPLVGQAYDCQWYQVAHPQLGEVWLSGSAQHVATTVSCDQVAAALIPTPQPAEAPTVASAATPVPTQAQQTDNPTPAQPVDNSFPADQGCLILQNQLGPELTFTFTSADSSWNDSIKVSAEHDIPYCFKPGNYRVTIDAPPPWPSLNLDFAIQAGYRAYFPIRPQ